MSRRPIMPNLERQVEVITLDREQLRRGLLSTGGWSETVASEHVASLDDTDGALQMLARHRIAFASAWQPVATAPRDGTWFFTKSDPDSYCPYDIAQFDLALGEFVKAGCGFQYVTDWRAAEAVSRHDSDSVTPASLADGLRQAREEGYRAGYTHVLGLTRTGVPTSDFERDVGAYMADFVRRRA